MPLQNFVANSLPSIKAAWLNGVDVLYFTVFQSAATVGQALAALGFTALGTSLVQAATAAAARTILGSTAVGDALFTAVSAAAGRLTLEAAASGANTDITSVGAVTGVTAAALDDSTLLATTAFVEARNFVGSVVQTAATKSAAQSTTGSNIPTDNTIPQVGEGAEVLSLVITPKFADSSLRIFANVFCSNSTSTSVTIAAFLNGAANSIGAIGERTQGADTPVILSLLISAILPASTSPQTISIRIGSNAGSAYFNGISSGTLYGAATVSTLIVEEIKA